MEIKHIIGENKGYFQILENNNEIGKMTYTRAGIDKMIINHTEVDPAYGGKGLGKELVMAAVRYVRKDHVKIVPLCPFAKRILTGNASLADVMI